MRTYDVLYSRDLATWSVIAKDDYDQSWFVYISDTDESTAKEVAEKFNAVEGQRAVSLRG